MFETSRAQTSRKTIQRFPIIKEPSDRYEVKKKNGCSKASLNSQISFPQLKTKKNDSVIKQKDSVAVSHTVSLSESLKCAQNVEQLIEEKDFDSCSDVLGFSKCQLLFKVPSSEINDDEFETEKEKVEESNALKRWEFWTKERIRLQNHFSKHLERSHGDLQFNQLDKFRQMVEGRTLFEYSQTPDADKWRGHPFHWKPPLCLSNYRESPDGDYENSFRYCAIKSKLEEGEVPEMEFIGIPSAIQKEKGLNYKSRKLPKKNWERTAYNEERITHFLKRKKRLKPSDIQMDELAVVGIKIPTKQEETNGSILTENIPNILITSDKEGPKESVSYRHSVFCLVIQGREMKYDIGTEGCQGPDEAFTWQVDFGINTVGCLVNRVLRVENRGTVAVRYDWLSKNIEEKLLWDSLKMKQRKSWFFFDKNSGFFLPGQIYDLKFYCHAKCLGIKKEVWYIKTDPPLSESQEMGTIVLSVMATEELLSEKEALTSYLEKRVRDSAVDFVIHILLNNVFSSTKGLRDIEYRSLFCEKELFENNNLKYYYHSEIIGTLKELIQESSSKKQTDWDLSLDTLVELVKTNKNGKEKNNLFIKIAEKVPILLRPSYVSVKNVKKYKMAFQVLCCTANFVEEDYDWIRNLVLQNVTHIGDSDMEIKELWSNLSYKSLKISNSDSSEVANNIIQTMFYQKTYNRVCEAMEQIAGILETNGLFQPRKKYDYKLEKPTRMNSSAV